MNKDNQIIADFMCSQFTNYVGTIDRYKWQLVKDGSWYEEKDLLYDKSWNWLMPVIEKIETLINSTLWIGGNSCNFNNIPPAINAESKILAAHEQCVKFINWHNKK